MQHLVILEHQLCLVHVDDLRSALVDIDWAWIARLDTESAMQLVDRIRSLLDELEGNQ